MVGTLRRLHVLYDIVAPFSLSSLPPVQYVTTNILGKFQPQPTTVNRRRYRATRILVDGLRRRTLPATQSCIGFVAGFLSDFILRLRFSEIHHWEKLMIFHQFSQGDGK